ncbi:SDR family NAD(P)-dependent oxidoreductase [Xanthomonas sp. AmX2]|uniref:SDR family NAD(P)-dependent oxidoreductase n=1 Tax=Xanthomonas sp. TaxID=29446 RepID=UPI00197CC7FB|nr:SDR family NAD(P)-dependent oxidoreductase [Xanthomonas sp.]MBN6150779.1 SDR family NAD(P)-dependent oxidoreductase [Xanthomonas sp.]
MDLDLDGKTALVTGSSKGIGEAIARKLAAENAVVVVHGRDQALAERVANDIVVQGGRAHAVSGDLTDADQAQRLAADAQRLVGPIDILVNNAGGSGGARDSWATTRADAWAGAYDRNVLAALRITTWLLPGMQRARWGRVINISSLAATMPPAFAPDYSACKAAMNAMTASMAKAVAGDGITVNAVSPGTIHSATLDARFRQAAAERGVADEDAPWAQIEQAMLPLFAQVPLGRVGRLDEVSAAVAFLASAVAGYITGINLRVDGGMSPGL